MYIKPFSYVSYSSFIFPGAHSSDIRVIYTSVSIYIYKSICTDIHKAVVYHSNENRYASILVWMPVEASKFICNSIWHALLQYNTLQYVMVYIYTMTYAMHMLLHTLCFMQCWREWMEVSDWLSPEVAANTCTKLLLLFDDCKIKMARKPGKKQKEIR